MGLSDSGKIWEWANGTTAGMLVKLISVDVAEGAKFGKGRVTRVVSGTARLVFLYIFFTHEICRLGGILRIYQRHGYRFLGANAGTGRSRSDGCLPDGILHGTWDIVQESSSGPVLSVVTRIQHRRSDQPHCIGKLHCIHHPLTQSLCLPLLLRS